MLVDTLDLKNNVNLASLIETDLGPACKRHGRWSLWRCPFHADTDPSLAVTPDTGTWHCFGCGKSGDAITWLRERQGLDFHTACERLGALPALPPPSTPRSVITDTPDGPPPAAWQEKARAIVDEGVKALWSDAGERAREWLHKRGLQDDALGYWHIGYNPADRKVNSLWLPRGIIVPCWQDGVLYEVKVRRPKGEPKYQAVSGSHAALFGAETLAAHQVAVLCEGMFDAMLLEQETGDLVGVATSTAPMAGWRASWTKHFLHCERVLVAYDTDPPGETHAAKLLAAIGRARRARVPIGKDITDYWQAGGNLRAWVDFLLFQRSVIADAQLLHETGDRLRELAGPDAVGVSDGPLADQPGLTPTQPELMTSQTVVAAPSHCAYCDRPVAAGARYFCEQHRPSAGIPF